MSSENLHAFNPSRHGSWSGSQREPGDLSALAVFNAQSLTRAALSQVGLDDFLQVDRRPSFVVDLQQDHGQCGLQDGFQLSYSNPALLEHTFLLDEVQGNFKTRQCGLSSWRAYADFHQWVLAEKHDSVAGASFLFKGFLWSASTVKLRWRIISGCSLSNLYEGEKSCSDILQQNGADNHDEYGMLATPPSEDDNPLTQLASLDPFTAQEYESLSSQNREYDWTVKEPPYNLSPHLRYARSVDWTITPLGSMDSWSAQLRAACNLVMSDVQAAVFFWGPEKTMIYNERYIPLIGSQHPCMGKSIFTALPECTDHVVKVISQINRTGEALYLEDTPLFLNRNGMIEEAYLSLKWLPLIGADGRIAGYYESIQESTQRVVLDRRINTFTEVGAQTGSARGLSEFWQLAIDALSKNEKDVPCALFYTIEDETHPSSISTSCSKMCSKNKTAVLQRSIGIQADHPAAPERLSLGMSNEGFAPYFREAMKSRNLMVIHVKDGSLPNHLVDGIISPAFGDPIRTFAISPIMPTSGDQVLGFFLMGCNTRRPFDDKCAGFISVISRMLSTSMASVVLLEEEANQRQAVIEQAAHDKAELSEQLNAKQRSIELQEQRFQRLAERVDVGIFITDEDGEYTYRNERWYDIFQVAKDESMIKDAWMKIVDVESLATCEHAWYKLSQEKVPISFELRLKRNWESVKDYSNDFVNPDDHKMWILASAYPELLEDGSIKEVVGIVTDISRLKWAERIQRQRTQDALEAKRQLENFIDTTSHEMRNPLSAITHCADGLLATANQIISTYPSVDSIPAERRELMDTVLDSAQTIIQCANHQRRIVDDVLTMSKLESGLLVVTPVDVQPSVEIYHCLKMFEAEARESKVEIGELKVEQGYTDRHVDWVLFDPTRVVQVFINLITNAIKFTRFEQEKKIVISIDASETEPPRRSHGVTYFQIADRRDNVPDCTDGQDWGTGEPLYIIITVQDTGRGLSGHERDLLFNRFSQASPRTHIQYGGNGLGLFISRRLAELQGGAIGFSSEPGNGSTFSFYVKARRSTRENTPIPPAPAEMNAQPTTPNQMSVLVVEDNLVNQRVLAKQLRKLGCVVDVANHGVEALKHIETTQYWTSATEPKELSVILMDWEMPVMDGLACVKKIRQLQLDGSVSGHVPVIAVTANARTQQINTAMEAGMDDVVSKPFRVPDLVVRMRALLEKLSTSP